MKLTLILFAIVASALAEGGQKSAIKPVPSKNLFMTCEPDMTDAKGLWIEMICTRRDGVKSRWKKVPDLERSSSHFDPSVATPPGNLINGQIDPTPPAKPILIDEEDEDESAPRF